MAKEEQMLARIGYPYRCKYCGKDSPPAFYELPEGWVWHATGKITRSPMCPDCQRTFEYSQKAIQLLRSVSLTKCTSKS